MPADRYELKFVIPLSARAAFLDAVREGLQPDPHGDEEGLYRVTSQYYDTSDLRFYWEKLDGVATRVKVRLRFYGEVEGGLDDRPAFLEIKHRRHQCLGKERVRLAPEGARELLEDGRHLADLADLVHPEDRGRAETIAALQSLSASLRLERVNVVTYRREAWMGTVDPRLRLTFDHVCEAYEADDYLDVSSRSGQPLVAEGRAIMELKFDDVVPRWIREAVTHSGFQVLRFSKYAAAVEALGSMARRRAVAQGYAAASPRERESASPGT